DEVDERAQKSAMYGGRQPLAESLEASPRQLRPAPRHRAGICQALVLRDQAKQRRDVLVALEPWHGCIECTAESGNPVRGQITAAPEIAGDPAQPRDVNVIAALHLERPALGQNRVGKPPFSGRSMAEHVQKHECALAFPEVAQDLLPV